MSVLINRAQPAKAYELSKGVDPDSEEYHNAHFQFHVARAARLSGQPDEVVRAAWDRAKESEGYSTQMEGDFHRDTALDAIKQLAKEENPSERSPYYEIATDEIGKALLFHEGNPNRLAAIEMAYGRLEFALRNYDKALRHHNLAHFDWAVLNEMGKEADSQWILNNRFHRIRTYAMQPRWHRSWVTAREDLVKILLHDTSRPHKLGALLAFVFGSHGIRWADKHLR